jgi:hypothetical protein
MFQFPGFASVTYVFSAGYSRSCGFPHSDIHGSKPVRGSPWLFAAYHVLHRLSAPRHPPNALKSLDRSHFSMPRDPDDTPWNEERPNSRWPAFAGFWDHRHWKDQLQGFASPPVPPDDGAGKACGQARLAMSRTTCNRTPPVPWHGKSNPFFTMSKIPSPAEKRPANPVSSWGRPASSTDCAKDQWEHAARARKLRGSHRTWWSQTGSNRRPPACKAGALPTELWPRQGTVVRCQSSGRPDH